MLRNQKNKLIGYLSNISLKRALALYIVIGLITAILCSLVMKLFFENWRTVIYQVHDISQISDDKQESNSPENENGYIPREVIPSKTVQKQLDIVNALEMVSIMISGAIAISGVSHLFYKKKLEEPIKILEIEMGYLGRDDLSFDCSYMSNDEMGDICATFNQMRIQLLENKINIWSLMESQRDLNAAFAHDIRTPLTVMKGYIQMLSTFYSSGKISEEKVQETLHTLERQINRMEHFTNTMKEIHTIEEWKLCYRKQTLKSVLQKIQKNLEGLTTDQIKIELSIKDIEEAIIMCDDILIQQVVDNLISNSLRFANSKILVTVELVQDKLYFYVKDDGRGFTKELLDKGIRPYFTTSDNHFGLGLTICRTLCKKHGGNLELINSYQGGAIACAYFYIK